MSKESITNFSYLHYCFAPTVSHEVQFRKKNQNTTKTCVNRLVHVNIDNVDLWFFRPIFLVIFLVINDYYYNKQNIQRLYSQYDHFYYQMQWHYVKINYLFAHSKLFLLQVIEPQTYHHNWYRCFPVDSVYHWVLCKTSYWVSTSYSRKPEDFCPTP